MWIAIFIVVLVALAVLIFLNQPRFGKRPSGARKERIRQSPNYRDGKFQNLSPTRQMTSGKSYAGSVFDLAVKKKERLKPVNSVPIIKTDLLTLDPGKDVFVWFGHSSYFIQVDGRRILVDPVFSRAGAPVFFFNTAFKATDKYRADDIPEIDYLVISHDHWDHLDYNSIKALKPKIRKVICGLGVGAHFEHWGFKVENIIEMDWNEDVALDTGFRMFCLPARHFSGRSLSPNQSLWASFLLQSPSMKIFIGGDSGYDEHYKEIGERFNEIDVAILENGQYDTNWKYIHTLPEQVVQTAKDLHAKKLIPVHNSRFALGYHPWDDPLRKITELHKDTDCLLLTPMIGQEVDLKDDKQVFTRWWEDLN